MNKNDKLLTLIANYKKTKNSEDLKKIIMLNEGLINWYLENTKIDITKDELYCIIVDAIEKACLKYDNNYTVSYFSLCIRAEILHNITKNNIQNKRLFENFLQIKSLIEERFGTTLEKDFSIFEDIIEEMEFRNLIPYNDKEEIKNKLYKILKDYYKSLESKRNEINFQLNTQVDFASIKKIMDSALTEKEKEFLTLTFGLFGKDKKTLREIGEMYNVSKTHVADVNEVSILKLKSFIEFYVKRIDMPFKVKEIKSFLEKILTRNENAYLLLSLGLFDNKVYNVEKISSIFSVSKQVIKRELNIGKEKIKMALNSCMLEIPDDFKDIIKVLKKGLTKEEFEIFCYKYGILEHDYLDTSIIADMYEISNNSVIEIANKAIKKIKVILDDNDKIKEFLRCILTDKEYIYLVAKFGLFNESKKSVQELANIYKASPTTITDTIKIAIGKINTLLIVNNYGIDFNVIKKFLEELLTDDEFKYLCLSYGLYGYDEKTRNEIKEIEDVSFKVISNNNMSSIDKVKRYLKSIAN